MNKTALGTRLENTLKEEVKYIKRKTKEQRKEEELPLILKI